MKKFYHVLILVAVFVCLGTVSVQARDVNNPIREEKEIILWEGMTYQLTYNIEDKYDNDTGEYVKPTNFAYSMDEKGIVTVEPGGLVQTVGYGFVTIDFTYEYHLQNDTYHCKIRQPIYVNEKRIEEYPSYQFDHTAMGIGTSKAFALKAEPRIDSYSGATVVPVISWSSSDPFVAKVDTTGVVTALNKGLATIKAQYVYYFIEATVTYTAEAQVIVTQPTLEIQGTVSNIFGKNKYKGAYQTNTTVTIQGFDYNYSNISVKSAQNLVVEKSWTKGVYHIYPKKAGNHTAIFLIDGKEYRVKFVVKNVYFTRNFKSIDYSFTGKINKKWQEGNTMLALYKGEKVTLKAHGFASNSKLKWSSSNKKVATVSSSGKVTAKADGYATISVTAEGMTITYQVGVASKTAIKAIRYASEHYDSIYSQPKRMSVGYYDCSSYVYRSYKDAGLVLGGGGWAPTAAALAQWCKNNGYTMYEGTIQTDKLLPGDLIFQTGADNGRYKGIYHVDLYVGNYTSYTVARSKFYGEYLYDRIVARPCESKSTIRVSSKNKTNTIKWNTVYGATGYKIYRSTTKYGSYTPIKSLNKADVTSEKDTAVKAGQTYYYKVRPRFKSKTSNNYGKFSDSKSVKTRA